MIERSAKFKAWTLQLCEFAKLNPIAHILASLIFEYG